MRSNRISRLGVLVALAFSLVLSLPALGQAGDRIKEIEDVDSVDLGSRTIFLAGTWYQVPSDVRIFGPNGQRFTLRSLKATDARGSSHDVHEVEFVAERSGSSWVLRSIKVLGYASDD